MFPRGQSCCPLGQKGRPRPSWESCIVGSWLVSCWGDGGNGAHHPRFLSRHQSSRWSRETLPPATTAQSQRRGLLWVQTRFPSWGGWSACSPWGTHDACVHTYTHGPKTCMHAGTPPPHCADTHIPGAMHTAPQTPHTLDLLKPATHPTPWGQLLSFSELSFHVCPIDPPPLSRTYLPVYTYTIDTESHAW